MTIKTNVVMCELGSMTQEKTETVVGLGLHTLKANSTRKLHCLHMRSGTFKYTFAYKNS